MKKLLIAAALVAMITPAFADDRDLTYKGTKELPTFSGNPATGDTTLIWDESETRWKTRAADTSSEVTISTAVAGNPFARVNHSVTASAAVSSVTAILAATVGKTVYPVGYTLTALGGATAGATTIVLECSGGTDIAAIPVATAASGFPVKPSTSAPSGTAQQNFFNSFNVPCPSGEGIQISKTGSAISGASSFELLFEYIIQ